MNKIPFVDIYAAMSADEKRELAIKANTSVAYLSQVANGHRKAGADFIARVIAVDQRLTFGSFRSCSLERNPEHPTSEHAA